MNSNLDDLQRREEEYKFRKRQQVGARSSLLFFPLEDHALFFSKK
jgi:hypothetical protein